MLLRDAVGETLRDARNRQNRTLRDVSTAANVSLGYLSEEEYEEIVDPEKMV